jgi:hypothetical protein
MRTRRRGLQWAEHHVPQAGHVVTVKITHTGNSDCTFKDIVVFFST